MKNKIKISLIAIFLIGISIGLFLTNKYIKSEKLLFYSKGINSKALMDINWKMSLKEIERASDCSLSGLALPDGDRLFGELSNIIENKRFLARKGCPINIWGRHRDVTFYFFDDQLYRFVIKDDVYNEVETDSLVKTKLSKEFGEFHPIQSKYHDYKGEFKSVNTQVEYLMYDNNDDETFHLLLTFTYTPFYNEIVELAKKEQEDIF